MSKQLSETNPNGCCIFNSWEMDWIVILIEFSS